MHRTLFYWVGGASLVFVACATSTAPGAGGTSDDDDSGPIPIYDAGNGTPTEAGTSCTLGTADHCGSCDTVCPGATDGGTTRVCSDTTSTATCDIVCTGEYYDLNGDIKDGCEAQDPIVHDSADAAVAEIATTGGATIMAPYWYAYGDARMHDVAPTSRPTGREDWYVISNPDGTPTACLTISNFPTDDEFEVCITNNGISNIENTQCHTITSTTTNSTNPSACVTPGMTGNNGKYWVRVRKLSGSNTANGYALYIAD